MSRAVRLRRWQKQALDAFARHPEPDFLAVATPGAGKTTFALTAAVTDLVAEPTRRVVVVTPTQHLKLQWTRAATRFGLHLEPSWSSREGRIPADVHGVVVTYQQVAGDPAALRGVAADGFVVFDEIHHAGQERAWGDAVWFAFELAARRLAVSGTPFRSDESQIPFVRYADDEAWPDFTYDYGEALAEGGVVRPVYFPAINGEMEWTAPDGTRHAHSFHDPLDATRSNQRLRTALSARGEWLPAVLDQAHAQLVQIRQWHPDAGGLVIAMDQGHAREIAALLHTRHGVHATVAVSEDPSASAKIAAFAESADPWIVAVRMVSEGVDIPRLRAGVYATNTTTELFFRQAVGRLVRWTSGLRNQKAYLFIPDDRRLRTWASQITEQRRHTLRRRDDEDEPETAEDLFDVAEAQPDEQLSLFEAISAVATGGSELPGHADDAPEEAVEDPEDGLTVELVAPPLGAAAGVGGPGMPAGPEGKRTLRDWNADRVRTLVQLTGMTYAAVNRALNEQVGIEKVSEATATQLRSRLEHAGAWLRRL